MQLYLTPTALSFLTQVILAGMCSAYFLHLTRQPGRPPHVLWLASFYLTLTGFLTALFLDAGLSPTQRLYYPVFVENFLLGLALICLLQFAYHFPRLPHSLLAEARLALLATVVYTAWEGGYAVYRFAALNAGQVLYRPNWSDYLLLALFLWTPAAFLRQLYILTAPASGRWFARLASMRQHPGSEAGALRSFILIFLSVAGLNLFNILRAAHLVPVSLANAGISAGILAALSFFAWSYLSYQPETTSFMVKLAGVTLTVILALLGMVGWVISPHFEAQYQPDLPDHRTLRFTPNDLGGYDISAAPFAFESDYGLDLGLDDGLLKGCSDALEFAFPFYGRDHDQVFVCNDGTLSFGQPVTYRQYQFRYGAGAPIILALLLDLDPTTGAGRVYARQDAGRLVVTWDRLPVFRHPELEFTFQAVLLPDGVFELTYNGLPPQLAYYPNDEPGATAWAVGALPGGLDAPWPQAANLGRAAVLPLRSGPQGVVQDFHIEFRQHLHRLFAPLAWLILAASALTLTGFPLLFQVSLVSPLGALLEGVKRMEAGDYSVSTPVQLMDEIGFLTQAFNRLAAEQRKLIHNLEERVAARTAELSARTEELAAANEQLQAEMQERQQAQAQVLSHQRTLAILEERERLGRELHDNLGQTLGYISIQTQAAQEYWRKDDREAVERTWEWVLQAAQQAHADVRGFILGLKAASQVGFLSALQQMVEDSERAEGASISLHVTQPWNMSWLTPVGELNLLRIVQEAVNNVNKHARAQKVTVDIHTLGDRLQVRVEDDGVGFDPAASGFAPPAKGDKNTDHFGLENMRRRAAELGGWVEIQSAPGEGARVLVEFPVRTAQAVENVPTEPLRVVLVDDHPMFLEGLRNLLEAHGMNVVGLGSNGTEAQALARLHRPDLIVMDLHMPGCDGLEATRRILAEWPEARIVVLTVSAEEEHIFEVLKAGAAGYLLKNMKAEDFFLLLAGLEQGAPPVAPELATRIERELAQAAAGEMGIKVALNPQQIQVLRLVGQGWTYREVGRQMHLSEPAIKYQMKQILERLHLANRAQAEAYARRAGLVGDEEIDP